ncbi:hypothetical protein KEJ18_01845 [Candidatus Bathyarchaeota archaeon]|nr:hypothetical protein [Candidatus Bathyarchaeota archaeon]
MRKLKAIGILLLVTGFVVILMSTVLPLVKMPQTFIVKGPSKQLTGNISYWIDTWILPPIDIGTSFSINIEANTPGGISIAILPSRGGEIILEAAPLLSCIFNSTQKVFSASTIVQTTSEYLVFVVCVRNNFTLMINSSWSPFYSFRILIYPGLGALPAGILIVYYDRILESKERLIREALKTNSRSYDIYAQP